MTIKKELVSIYVKGRKGEKVSFIVFHGTMLSDSAALRRFKDPHFGRAPHFLIAADGTVIQCVELGDTATMFHHNRRQGHPAQEGQQKNIVEAQQVSIVCCTGKDGQLTDAQLDSAAALCRTIREQLRANYHSDLPLDAAHILTHSSLDPQIHFACPGPQFPLLVLLARLAPPKPPQNAKYRAMITNNYRQSDAKLALSTLAQQGFKTPKLLQDGQVWHVVFAPHPIETEADTTVHRLKRLGWHAKVQKF